MNNSFFRSLLLCMSLAFIPLSVSSCAYTQLNKQIEEKATVYNGFAVELPLSLYSSQGRWYVKVRKIDVQRMRPFVHDSVMLKTGGNVTYGTVKPLSYYTEYQYISISDGTAAVLQRADGYATLETLCDEIKSNYAGAVPELPESMQHRVYADIKTEQGNIIYVAAGGKPIRQAGIGIKALSKLALVCVDIPGTVAYNAAMPVIAPFLFFHDFITDDTSLTNTTH